MMMHTRRFINTSVFANPNSIRQVSAFHVSTRNNNVELTVEEREAGLRKVEAYRKHVMKSTMPITLSQAMGTGEELHVPKDETELAVFSGMPTEHQNRTVIISQRMNKTLSSGSAYAHQWQLTWKNQKRWSNPLMGWTSSSDPMSNVKLNFDAQDDAVAFAKKNGWKYEVLAATSKTVVEAGTYTYAENFLPKRVSLQLKREGQKTKLFEAPGYGDSQFFMPLKYHGVGEVLQHGPPGAKV
jgi:NADH dehydrogenase (ubiquinone) Fe-S protein 4